MENKLKEEILEKHLGELSPAFITNYEENVYAAMEDYAQLKVSEVKPPEDWKEKFIEFYFKNDLRYQAIIEYIEDNIIKANQ